MLANWIDPSNGINYFHISVSDFNESFWLPIEGKPHWELREIEKGYELEEELRKLGFRVDFPSDEEIEDLMSDSKDISAKVFVDWTVVNLDFLEKIIFPLDKWKSNHQYTIDEAERVWKYAKANHLTSPL